MLCYVLRQHSRFYRKLYWIKQLMTSFANSSPIFTIFRTLVNNDIVDRSHDFGCHQNHCVTIGTKMGILLNWLAQAEYKVYNNVWYIIGKLVPSAFQWYLRNSDIVYIKIIISNLTASFQIITVELSIIIVIYMVSQFLKYHWNAEWISFPMMHHNVL